MLKATVLSAVATAKQAVQDLAIPASLVSRTAQAYVPGQPVTEIEVVTPIKMVLVRYKISEIDGERVQATDWQALVFHDDGTPVPKANDVIRVNRFAMSSIGVGAETTLADYRVIDNARTMAGDVVALSQVQLRLT